MAILRFKEVRNLPEKEVEEKERELKKELMKLNSQRSTGTPPENPGRIKEIRRTLARINTHRVNKKMEVRNNK